MRKSRIGAIVSILPSCQIRAVLVIRHAQAEFTRTLTKGSYVMVQGAVRTHEYERDGVKHRVVEVRADTVGKLDRAERRIEAEDEPDAGDA